MDKLLEYNWPGNVRELRNTVERAVILGEAGELGIQHLPPGFGEDHGTSTQNHYAGTPAITGSTGRSPLVLQVGTTVNEAERQLILRTLESTGGNKTKAAEVLSISLKTLHNKLKEYSADDPKAAIASERS
jgi:DNA-binding NtrC family response regulator